MSLVESPRGEAPPCMLLRRTRGVLGQAKHLRFLVPLRPVIATAIMAATGLFFLRRRWEIPLFGRVVVLALARQTELTILPDAHAD